MPKAPKSSVNTRPQRRSSRLSNIRHEGNGSTVQSRSTQKLKVAKDKSNSDDISVSCTAEAGKNLGGGDRRRSQRINLSDLTKREKSLLEKEEEYKRWEEELQEQKLSVQKREDKANMIMQTAHKREAQSALAQLDEHFNCALCYEVMAHPYTLNPGPCGHTFCAICILKWFFSRLHKACGGWHESVDCPICRSLLVITPDRTPRLDITFPFVPNRIAAAVCESLIQKLSETSSDSMLSVKREDSEGVGALVSAWDNIQFGTKKGSKSKQQEEMEEEDSKLDDWSLSGSLRADWVKKERDGKREMQKLLKGWTTFRSQDFISMKQSLGV
ncbi:hypothetical protein C8J56DRAFT_872436 [Mycena floridula]|nr:hypothetical protein C8J56DRAFT_872436 [Mycena floridula]